MSNGKGDTPRPCNGDRFRSNWDGIDWRRKDRQKETTTKGTRPKKGSK